jgi:nitrite reductase/ring-hydroxylating ferredoxin subunit
MRYRLTSLADVREEGSYLFTVQDSHGEETEVFLIPCDEDDRPPVQAWVNNCTHEQQRLYREEIGVITRDNGDAAETTLLSVDIDVEDGQVYLTDDDVQYLHEGPAEDDDDDDMPGSSSHLQL